MAKATESNKPVAFKRMAPVTLPTLKQEDGKSIFVRFDSRMLTKPKTKGGVPLNDESGNPATITTATVVDISTGEMATIVIGAMLKSVLNDYKGGGEAYVGRCFEITKDKAKPGKRSKEYAVYEIEDPSKV